MFYQASNPEGTTPRPVKAKPLVGTVGTLCICVPVDAIELGSKDTIKYEK